MLKKIILGLLLSSQCLAAGFMSVPFLPANNKLSAFAATTSAELAGVISNETGSGLLVFNTSPTFNLLTSSVAAGSIVNAGSFISPGMSNNQMVYIVLGTDTNNNNGFYLTYNHNSSSAGRFVSLQPNETGAAAGKNLAINADGQVFMGYTSDQGGGEKVQIAGKVKSAGIVQGQPLCLPDAPVVASGFGTSASIAINNGTCAFTVNVGTGGTATNGVITLPSGSNGWVCNATDKTNHDSYRTIAYSTSATSITVKNYSSTTGISTAWAASDIIEISCFGY